MRSLRILDRRTGNRLASILLILSTVVPGLVPAFASAAQVSDRSITLSSSAAGATSVTYEVQFTIPSGSADSDAFILDFCNDSPIPGQTCTAPSGFSATGVGTSTSGATVTHPAASTVKVVKTYQADDVVDVVLTGLTNPTAATTSSTGFYARIVTYDTSAHADAYAATDLHAGAQDEGGIAMAITNEIAVSAAVRESMIFCVANQTITANCGDAATAGHQPNLEIGEGSAGARALDPSAVSTAAVYTQLSTNAASGGTVRLKSDATNCGGLVRVGAPSSCDIKPADGTAGYTTVAANVAAFGIKTAASSTASSGAADATGLLEAISPVHMVTQSWIATTCHLTTKTCNLHSAQVPTTTLQPVSTRQT
jgi:hypothetical protein